MLERSQKLKVRLACIDAPETAQNPYGSASRNQLKALLPLGSTVSLRVQALDHYGRSVAEVIGQDCQSGDGAGRPGFLKMPS